MLSMLTKKSSVWKCLNYQFSSHSIFNECRRYGIVAINRFILSLYGSGVNKVFKHHKLVWNGTKSSTYQNVMYYSFDLSDRGERRMDLYTKIDETVGKWNNFYVHFNKKMENCSPDDNILLSFCEGLSDKRLPLACNLWSKGDIFKSYIVFSVIYEEENYELQQEVLTVLQCFIFHTLRTKGYSWYVVTVEGAKRFAEVENEICIMITVWYSLFISEMASDWKRADKVMTDDLKLQKSIGKMFILFGYYCLKNNDMKTYQRLIEEALKYDKEVATRSLLRELFNYYYKMNYNRGCEVVYKCCTDIGIKLTHDQMVKYIMIKEAMTEKKKKESKISKTDDIKYKF